MKTMDTQLVKDIRNSFSYLDGSTLRTRPVLKPAAATGSVERQSPESSVLVHAWQQVSNTIGQTSFDPDRRACGTYVDLHALL